MSHANSRIHRITSKRLTETVQETFWHLRLVHKETGECQMCYPQFIVQAETWREAVAKVEKHLDREEFPSVLELQPEALEFGDKDVAWI